MSYCRQCGAELPEGARFCPACGVRVISKAKPVEMHRTLKVTGKPKVVVKNVSPGRVEVEPGTEGEVTVDLDLRVPEDLDCNISHEGNTVTVTCRAIASIWRWPSHIFGVGPRANILVSVPEEADLNLENRAGRLKVAGVKGILAAESSAGTVTIQDSEGTVKARTSAGSINMKNVSGTVTARSSAGSIKFNGALSKGENWFRTSVGSIDIALQGEPDLTVEASTSIGSIRVTPELADTRYERNRHTGRIGAGTGRLIAETKTGSIRIRH